MGVISMFDGEVVGNASLFNTASLGEQGIGREARNGDDQNPHDRVGVAFDPTAEKVGNDIDTDMRVVACAEGHRSPGNQGQRDLRVCR